MENAETAASLEQWRAERNQQLAALNMQWAREMMLNTTDEVRLIAMHKARVETTGLEDSLRLESVEWLRDRGMTRFGGAELPPPGEVP